MTFVKTQDRLVNPVIQISDPGVRAIVGEVILDEITFDVELLESVLDVVLSEEIETVTIEDTIYQVVMDTDNDLIVIQEDDIMNVEITCGDTD